VNGNTGHESSDGAGAGAGGAKQPRAKNWRLDKMSWNDIRRPAGVMQNYISQRQVELAGVGEKNGSVSGGVVQAFAVEVNGTGQGKARHKEKGKSEGDPDEGVPDSVDGFRRLSTLQMMDDLSRELVLWQRMVQESQGEK